MSMKVIGDINAIDETYQGYEGGQLVALTRDEISTLHALQQSSQGFGKIYISTNSHLENLKMDDLFFAIRAFVTAQFYLNQFETMVRDFREMLPFSEDAQADEMDKE